MPASPKVRRNPGNIATSHRRLALALMSLLGWMTAGPSHADDASDVGDRLVREYLAAETAAIESETFAEIESLQDWERRRDSLRQQLAEMLGLDPMPPRSPLQATIVGTLPAPSRPLADPSGTAEPANGDGGFVVEKLHFQPMPGLYVGANLYRPAKVSEPLPAILYVCGHATGIEGGVRMGNKTAYQHHGAWFARNGYVCLIIDTIQRGEFDGIHHGTYRYGMWWWNNRGYTPAGVEAWTGIRAVDYLQSRPEVDGERIGITGRSGGGVYSWWVAALDDRIAAAVPVAGITTLRNHVVDGCVEGHCDCMFMVNTYRWDYPVVAALVAPRPLLISNSDKDRIFPLDGVVALHAQVRKIYRLYDAEDRLGLQITEGPHKDTQELRVHAFRWMNRFLKGDDALIREPAEKYFTAAELKVFDTLPSDERVTTIHESFVPAVDPETLPASRQELSRLGDRWRSDLREKTFAGWPSEEAVGDAAPQAVAESVRDGVRLSVYEFQSQSPYRLPFYLVSPAQPDDAGSDASRPPRIRILDQRDWDRYGPSLTGNPTDENASDDSPWLELAADAKEAGGTTLYFAPRGVGPTEWSRDERTRTHLRRRFMLLGQTDDGMRVWDVLRLFDAVDRLPQFSTSPKLISASRDAAAWSLYAALYRDDLAELRLTDLPPRNRDGINLLNVSRILQPPQLVLAVADRVGRIVLHLPGADATSWRSLRDSELFAGEGRIELHFD